MCPSMADKQIRSLLRWWTAWHTAPRTNETLGDRRSRRREVELVISGLPTPPKHRRIPWGQTRREDGFKGVLKPHVVTGNYLVVRENNLVPGHSATPPGARWLSLLKDFSASNPAALLFRMHERAEWPQPIYDKHFLACLFGANV